MRRSVLANVLHLVATVVLAFRICCACLSSYIGVLVDWIALFDAEGEYSVKDVFCEEDHGCEVRHV